MKKILLLFIVVATLFIVTGCDCEHEIIVDKAVTATCTQNGLTEGSHCSKCGIIIEAQKIIEPLGHSYVIDNDVNVSCTENGLTTGLHCSQCGEVLIAQNTVVCSGHLIIIDEAVEPTCENYGLTEGSHCSKCGEIIVKQEELEPLGHNYVIDVSIDATCTENGLSTGLHCSKCKKILVNQNVVNCSGHTIVVDQAIEATCDDCGLTEGSHCSQCGLIIVEQEIIEPLGHIYVFNEEIESTCSKQGKTMELSCSRCEKIFIESNSIEKISHTKGKFISLTTDAVEAIDNPAIFECSVCQEHYYDSIKYEDINLPIMNLSGDLTEISKTNKVHVQASYEDLSQNFSYDATLKIQGGYSQSLPKKNYNIQFYKDDTLKSKQKVKLIESWGKESKYTMKANYVDFSQMRNVVSGKIYGDIVHSQSFTDRLSALVNGGAIDGFPILVYINGVYNGIYTLNIPKDDWLFGMDGDSTSREAIVMASDWTNSCALMEPMASDFSNGWELEYSSTEDDVEIGNSWVVDSFNNMINFINQNDGEAFKNGIDAYINVPRAIDSMLYTWFINAGDNTAKNIVWATFDGVQWIPSVYDLDGTWGLVWDGSVAYSADAWIPYTSNNLWNKLYSNYYSEIKSRWEELREGPLSIENIDKQFVNFMSLIPSNVYETEQVRWAGEPSQKENNLAQIINWSINKLKNLDSYFETVIEENIPYSININVNEHASVKVFINDNYSLKSDYTAIAYSRDGDTGYLTKNSGQINFEIVLDEGYEVDYITVSGTYKNLKDSEETKRDNTYRVTKIASDIVISVYVKKSNE